MPLFNDVERYHGLEVPFFKRAQLTAADLHLAFQGQGLGHFTDLDQLTIFADNLVPHVLRIDKVLRYEDDLAARIDREEPIPAGSPEEVEIRACAVHAVELLVEHPAHRGPARHADAGRLPSVESRAAALLQEDPAAAPSAQRVLLRARRPTPAGTLRGAVGGLR